MASAKIAALLALVQASAVHSLLLREVPMLHAHDAATGYLKEGILTKAVYDWTITQKGTFAEQLDCGVRGFDLRPHVNKKGDLVMHHGGVEVDTKLSKAVSDAASWVVKHPGELVVFVQADCSGTDCGKRSLEVYADAGIHTVTCSQLENLTYADALTLGKYQGGGSVLAFPDGCNRDNYQPTVTCYPPYKYKSRTAVAASATKAAITGFPTLGCYWSSKDEVTAFNNLYLYLNRTAAVPLLHNSGFTSMQSIWQESTDSVPEGILSLSSLIKDEERSEINKKVAEKLEAGWWQYVNLFEVNNVCDQGPRLHAVLQKRLAALLKQ
eukprot:TRINITY_DN24011_c0_g1_i1.p1 TRINITY_DN24011_c0_g1~~TRINITY_DN24011_c0_g1_i1.p1  ORF type:complete len:338 (+),score=159.03 TRINITY_DN24011_c0_g1_i1:41-1015(+)